MPRSSPMARRSAERLGQTLLRRGRHALLVGEHAGPVQRVGTDGVGADPTATAPSVRSSHARPSRGRPRSHQNRPSPAAISSAPAGSVPGAEQPVERRAELVDDRVEPRERPRDRRRPPTLGRPRRTTPATQAACAPTGAVSLAEADERLRPRTRGRSRAGESAAASPADGDDEALVDEARDDVERLGIAEDGLGRVEVERRREDREPRQRAPIARGQELDAPVDGGPQRPLAIGRVGRAAGEQAEAPGQPRVGGRRARAGEGGRPRARVASGTPSTRADLRDGRSVRARTARSRVGWRLPGPRRGRPPASVRGARARTSRSAPIRSGARLVTSRRTRGAGGGQSGQRTRARPTPGRACRSRAAASGSAGASSSAGAAPRPGATRTPGDRRDLVREPVGALDRRRVHVEDAVGHGRRAGHAPRPARAGSCRSRRGR